MYKVNQIIHHNKIQWREKSHRHIGWMFIFVSVKWWSMLLLLETAQTSSKIVSPSCWVTCKQREALLQRMGDRKHNHWTKQKHCSLCLTRNGDMEELSDLHKITDDACSRSGTWKQICPSPAKCMVQKPHFSWLFTFFLSCDYVQPKLCHGQVDSLVNQLIWEEQKEMAKAKPYGESLLQ